MVGHACLEAQIKDAKAECEGEQAKWATFILEDALSAWTNLGKDLLFVWLCVSSIKTDTRRIMRLDELSSVARLERRTTNVCPSSSRRIMRPLVKKPPFKMAALHLPYTSDLCWFKVNLVTAPPKFFAIS